MRIVVIGTRGIPDILGGVETHCQELYPRIAAMGHDVTVIRRSCYVEGKPATDYQGVHLVDVYAPRKKSIEAIVHTALAIIKARQLKPDVLHIHAIGPALLTPLARLLGMRVVMTNHGPDYGRQKWGRLAKTILKAGEAMGTRFANKVIVISTTIADILRKRHGRADTELIYNGVPAPIISGSRSWLDRWGVDRPYIVAIGRFVKEKGFHDLIDAYLQSGLQSTHALVIAGDADHPDQYSESLKAQARQAGVVLTGFIKGEPLTQLMAGASLFVLPSYHEGLPISLLEAMSYGLDVAVSDIPANRLPQLDPDDFFPAGNVDALAQKLRTKIAAGTERHYDLTPYNWDSIARQTVNLYQSML